MTTIVCLVAILHGAFFALEFFFWNHRVGKKVFQLSDQQAQDTEVLAKNMGLYNLVLAIGLVIGLVTQALSVLLFILGMIVVVGIYGGISVKRSILFTQSLPALIAFFLVFRSMAHPVLNDISTHKNLAFQSIETIYPLENWQIQREHYPEVRRQIIKSDLSQIYNKALSLVEGLGWEVQLEERELGRIEAIATTSLMNYKDDIIIQITDIANGFVQIDMRSKSRVGKSDFGTNAKRITQFLGML